MNETLLQEIVNLEEQERELDAKKTEIEGQEYPDLDQLRQVTDDLNMVRNKLAEKREELEQQQRLQIQEQKIEQVDEMELPYDFNDIFNNSNANAIIRELLKDQYRKLYDDHNEEIAKLNAEYKDKLRAAEEREIELKRQNEYLQASLNLVSEERDQLKVESVRLNDKIKELQDELNDRNQKLSNAAAEIDRLNSHIEDLRDQLNRAPAPTASFIDVTQSANLAEMVNKAKTETEQKKKLVDVKPIGAGLYVEGINPETGAKEVVHRSELAEPEAPTVKEVEPAGEPSFRSESQGDSQTESGDSGIHPAEVAQAVTFQQVDGQQNTGLASETHEGVQTQAPTVTYAEFVELKDRVDWIYEYANIPVKVKQAS